MNQNQVEMIPGVVFVVADEALPPVVEPAPPAPQPRRDATYGIPWLLVVLFALVVALAVVALPAVIFDWFSGAVLFGMLCAALVAVAIAVVAYPPPPNQLEYFWTVGSEPVGQCTPSRNTLTGRTQ